MFGGERESELHPCFLRYGAASEFGRRSLVEKDPVVTNDKVPLSHGVGRIDAVLLEEQLHFWETVDRYETVAVD